MTAAQNRHRVVDQRRRGVRWASPDGRWELSGGGPKSHACLYTLTDTRSGYRRQFVTQKEARQWAFTQVPW